SNTISNGAIYLNYGLTNSIVTGNHISGNGIYVENRYLNSGSPSVLANNIFTNNNITASARGIDASGPGIAEVSGNKVTGVTNAHGISLASVSGTLVANNFVQTQGLGTTHGISLTGGSNIKIVFNSVHT